MIGNSVLRDRGEHRAAPVTHMETLFDLVYVFAFTQLSEHLYEHLNLTGGLEALVLLLALWWAWSDTAWATGWVDPERVPVVLLLVVLMALGLVAASAVTQAFTVRGEKFAYAYVAMQVLRGLFMVAAFGRGTQMGRNYLHLLSWSAISGVLWIAGALVQNPHTRLLLWALGALIDISAPMHGYRLPWVGSTPAEDWTVAGGHLAERCELVVMVAFGETILRIGEAFTNGRSGPFADVGFVVGFVLIVSLVVIYFRRHAAEGATVIQAAGEDTTTVIRAGYTYPHTLMIAAVVALAVAIHKVIEGPHEHVSLGFAMVCIGAPTVYLLAIAMAKRLLGYGDLRPLLVGSAALVLLGIPVAVFSERVVTLGLVCAVSVGVAAWTERLPRSARGSG